MSHSDALTQIRDLRKHYEHAAASDLARQRQVTMRAALTGRLHALSATLRRYTSSSDVAFWRSDHSCRPEWDNRSQLLASRVHEGSVVVDLGAGIQAVRESLPARCVYIPVDLVARTPDTVVVDFNSRRPWPELSGDWVIVSGLLEYLSDADRLVRWLSSRFSNVAVSYVVNEGEFANRYLRRRRGCVNDYGRAHLQTMFL